MILLIDNNDSFTYNIVDMIRKVSNEEIDVVSSLDLDINDVHKYKYIILSPGASLPQDYPVLELVLKLFVGKKPILGICLGHQAICRFFGSELVNYSSPLHGVESKIYCDKHSLLFKDKESMSVGRYHSWVVKDVAEPLSIVAKDENGDIMGVESRELKIFGVQFHPESYITKGGEDILLNFLK